MSEAELSAMRVLNSEDADFSSQLEELLQWDVVGGGVDADVDNILQQVKRGGDAALLALTQKFDGHAASSIEDLMIAPSVLEDAWRRIDAEARQALELAAERIRVFHERQLEPSWTISDEYHNEMGQRISALERVGVYVPGGHAAYPSSVLMTLIPAKVAGVSELVVTSPTPGGAPNDMVLAALHLGGADKVFRIGGAQAVGALAYGTETIPRVDKIVGPGNAYVAAAKRQVFGQVGIDMIAGPSEVLVLADGTTSVEWAVLDLFSQAEHDASAQSILISTDADFLQRVAQEIAARLPQMSRRETIAASLKQRGALIHCRDREEAVALANQIAPEHLELAVAEPDRWLEGIKHAGAIFVGAHTGETFGDYLAGPSHVLPTFGTARFASPLGVYDFQKRSSVIRLSPEGASALAGPADLLAGTEGLEAHALAARVRGNR